MDLLVSTNWLAAELADPALRVFDATYYLPNEGRDAEAEFIAGHVPGAQRFDHDQIADRSNPLPHMAPSAAVFAIEAARLGLANSSRVVFYDQKGMFSAPRAWWLLKLFGHEQAAVMDGGLPKWRREGRPLERGPARPRPAGAYRASLDGSRLRSLEQMRANLGAAHERVLDARSAGRYAAREPEPRAALRGGHIPGSQSLPWTNMLTPDQTLLSPEELRERFRRVGADERSAVITTCGSGVSAALLSFARARAGWPMGALYDGSWAEWGGRNDTPVHVGDQP